MAAKFGASLRKLSTELQAAPKDSMLIAVKAVKALAATEAARDTGGDGRLSGMRGARLSLRDDLTVGANQASVHIYAPKGAKGAWTIVTYGAKGHAIGPKRKKRGNKAMAFGGDFVRGPVRHPGSRAKGTFERVKRQAPAEVRKACNKAVVDTVRRVWG